MSFSTGSVPSADAKASLGVYEAEHEPDKDVLGSAVAYGYEAAINSDPYSFVAYRGGWAVADAGANDVLWISHSGAIKVLAVLPTIREYAKADTFGSTQTRAIEAAVQAVPTAVAVGPDGDLYVGELGGSPFTVGTEDVYRIVRVTPRLSGRPGSPPSAMSASTPTGVSTCSSSTRRDLPTRVWMTTRQPPEN